MALSIEVGQISSGQGTCPVGGSSHPRTAFLRLLRPLGKERGGALRAACGACRIRGASTSKSNHPAASIRIAELIVVEIWEDRLGRPPCSRIEGRTNGGADGSRCRALLIGDVSGRDAGTSTRHNQLEVNTSWGCIPLPLAICSSSPIK